MFNIIALVCVLGQDPAECQPPTAHDVIVLHKVDSELACLRESQMHLAKAASLVAANEYVKIACVREKD